MISGPKPAWIRTIRIINFNPMIFFGRIVSETGEDRCECRPLATPEKVYKICEIKLGIKTEETEYIGLANLSGWKIRPWVRTSGGLGYAKKTGRGAGYLLGRKTGRYSYVMTLGYISRDTFDTMGISYCGAYPEDARCENFRMGAS